MPLKNQPPVTDAEAAALVRATVRLFGLWSLTDAEARILLGGLPAETWDCWKRGAIGAIGQDVRVRMALLMGIHKGLCYLFRDPVRRYAWVGKPNTDFGGQCAKEVMLGGELEDLVAVREYLSREGGWNCKTTH